MLSRFFILTSIIGVFLLIYLISQFFLYFMKNNHFLRKNANFFSASFILLLILIIQPKQIISGVKFSLLMHYSIFYSSDLTLKFIRERSRGMTLKLTKESFKDDDDFFWKELKKIKTTGMFITTSKTVYSTLRLAYKPILLDNNSIDLLPYHPTLVKDYKGIIEDVFGINFFNLNDKYKRLAIVPDDLIKGHFEKLTAKEWSFFKK